MLVATPNLCLDITVRLHRLVPGSVGRAKGTDTSAGGKGVNVARAAAILGAEPVLCGFLAAEDGARLTDLLARERLALQPIHVAGVTRVSTILLEDDGRVTVVNGRGPDIATDLWQAYRALIAQAAPAAEVLVCSGSLPPGLPVEAYRDLGEIGHRAGLPVVVDAAPAVLAATLRRAPDLVSPNLSEAESLLFGRTDELVDEYGDDIAERALLAATALHRMGAVRAVVTAGASGAALCSQQGSWWLPAPRVQVVNPIGAGDCFVAGASLALVSGAADLDIVRRGMATASASCETATAGRLDRARAAELFEAIRPRRATAEPGPDAVSAMSRP